jgi:hypothetical protein
MGLFDKMNAAIDAQDADAYLDLLHDDHTFVRHQSGTEMNKSDGEEMIRGMMASGRWTVTDRRCIYENDDIMVTHSKMSFPDGSREAVMTVNLLKDGKIVRTETGATPLK